VSPLGRLCALAAAALAIFTIATWNAGEQTTSAATRDVDGAHVFAAKGCASCHVGPEGGNRPIPDFPSLAVAWEWAGERRPELSAEDYIRQSIREPDTFISPAYNSGFNSDGSPMPQLDLTDAEVDAVVAYLLGR
jgi:mono/diheme cytochrome c family protein